MRGKLLVVIAAVAALLLGALIVYAADEYHLLKEIKIGGAGQWDYLSVDSNNRRLYVSHGAEIVVIDMDSDSVVGKIAGTPGVHGFVAVPELGKGFSTNGQENKSSVVDLKTLDTLSKVDTGTNPDTILYDPKNQEIYTFNGRSNDATVFKAATGQVVATIPLGGKPETGVVDTRVNRVYVNNEDKNEMDVIDTTTHQVVAQWSIAPGMAATGLAFDPATRRLFVGCSNSMLIIMDSTNGNVLQSIPVGPGVDAAAFDPVTGYVFASAGGDGTVTVIKGDASGKYSIVQTLKTAPRSRTMTLDPKTHKIYLSAVELQAAAAPPAGAPPAGRGGRGAPAVPDSFKVLVFGM